LHEGLKLTLLPTKRVNYRNGQHAKAPFVGADGGCGELSASEGWQVVEGEAELLAGGS